VSPKGMPIDPQTSPLTHNPGTDAARADGPCAARSASAGMLVQPGFADQGGATRDLPWTIERCGRLKDA
jgi:hypothetical protein